MSTKRQRGALRLPFTTDRVTGLPVPSVPNGFDRRKLGSLVVTYRDTKSPGLLCLVSPSGRKTFALRYRQHGTGKPRKVTLGQFPGLSVEGARRKAERLLGRIHDGADPVAERRAGRAAGTVAELGEHYLNASAGRLKPSTVRLYRDLLRLHIGPALGALPVGDVQARHVQAMASRMKDTPTAANQALRLCSTLFRFAMRRGDRRDNPAQFVTRYKEQLIERYLSAAEIAAIGRALDKAAERGLPPAPRYRRAGAEDQHRKHTPKAALEPLPANPYAVAALRFLLLTGMRKREALELRWDAVDRERKRIQLGDSKTGRSIRPLTDAALAVLDSVPRIVGSAYCFPSPVDARHPLRDVAKLWYAVLHEAGLKGIRIHDLRHTAASMALQHGASLAEVQRMLGQRSVRAAARYAHIADAGALNAAERAVAGISAALALPVVPAQPLVRSGTKR